LPNEEGTLTFISMIDERGKAAVDRGRTALHANADDLPWQVFAYDAFVTLPKGRCEAVVVELRTYGENATRSRGGLSVPARDRDPPVRDPRPDARPQQPVAERVALINGAMDKGIQGYAWPEGKSWNECASPA